ncbi:MEKHLA domain-containing protein [Aestuariivirga litoralis]|uniref:MEKHLA domain-containing protein n=1 Tax=Aestuariivirga litoralis TaxID=2650924 RepID=UPI0018C6D53D|nr:MEKHLA domain-containing protein [Aestuariivirga litoralis]MBG1231037.1 MEKHLA domain-containing protein [Aestuariivirga litoralis]
MQPHLTPESQAFARLLAESFTHWTGRDLLTLQMSVTPAKAGAPLQRAAQPAEPPLLSRDHAAPAEALYTAPFALVAHGTEPDPIFCYANRAAQALWEMDWAAFTQLPSRMSAEPASAIQDDRNRLMAAALANGWIADYSGIRVSATGRRFEIRDTVLWNVVDGAGKRWGQAARVGESVKLLAQQRL